MGTVWGELNNRMSHFTLKRRYQLLENLQVESIYIIIQINNEEIDFPYIYIYIYGLKLFES